MPIPPMPPIPPGMPPIPPPCPGSSGLSAIIASVVINNPDTEKASKRAVRTTFVGSMIPLFGEHKYEEIMLVMMSLIMTGINNVSDYISN